MSACPNCGFSRKADAHMAKVRQRQRDRVDRGLGKLRAGYTMREAAAASGYADEPTFSRACLTLYGKRPLAMVKS